MRIPGPLLAGTLIERENRFRALVDLATERVRAHLANPGRLPELLYPGARVFLRKASNPERKTAWDLVLVRKSRITCCLDTRLANEAFAEALERREISEFAGFSEILREQRHGASRLDFILNDGGRRCLIEVKSVSLVLKNRQARFPDAPTLRGARHVRELAVAARAGEIAWVVFVCQRPDPNSVTPNLETDPDFGAALAEAHRVGVRLMALTCRVTTRSIAIAGRVPVLIDGKAVSR